MLQVPEHLLMREVIIPKRLVCQERKEFDPHSRGHALHLRKEILCGQHDGTMFMSRVPARVHDNDRHRIAAALVMVNGLDEEDNPALHKVMIVSDNTKHLAVADTRKLGIEVIKAGMFLHSSRTGGRVTPSWCESDGGWFKTSC